MPLSAGARSALGRLARGKFHNASQDSLAQLAAGGLVTLDEQGAPTITAAGHARAAARTRCAVEHYRRTRHVGTM